MNLHWFAAVLTAGALVLANSAGRVAAQDASPGVQNAPQPGLAQPNLTQPNLSTNGPAGTAVQTRTTKNLYSNGTEVDSSQSFQKSQSYSSGNGALSAKTHIQTTGPVTVVKPPNASQETPQ